jgi:protein-tyrosine-phosphatase
MLSEAIAALRESECDASAVVVRKPSAALFASADLVVTIGTTYRRDLLTATPQHRREHWLIPGRLGADAREHAHLARDLIRSRVAMLVCIQGWGRADLSRDTARVTRPRRTVELVATL